LNGAYLSSVFCIIVILAEAAEVMHGQMYYSLVIDYHYRDADNAENTNFGLLEMVENKQAKTN